MTVVASHAIFFLANLVISLVSADTSSRCNPICGKNHLPYPFGFSPGCLIPLNCSSTGDLFMGEFPVYSVNEDTIKISLETKCTRPVQVLQTLFSNNYQPKSTNAILLHNCTKVSPCNLTTLNVETHFETVKCSQDSNISCFNQETGDLLFNHSALPKLLEQCQYLLSSISAAYFQHGHLMSLDVQAMGLTWWLPGDCKCSKDANCTKFNTWNGRGYRCKCRNGLIGDGYASGVGCRKDCNARKYLSGHCGGEIRIAVLTGGIIGTAAVLLVCLWLCCCFIRRHSIWTAKSYRRCCITKATDISIPVYPYREIDRATSGFSEKQRLGTGAYGTVYSGKLHNDLWVAIKRIRQRDTDSIEQFMNEINLISSVSHPNLVRLLGCSVERGEQILVYEFMPNGTLCQHLQKDIGKGLPWPIRLAIATQTAQAIAHLHSFDPPIYHRDIKSSNILLDYDFRSKVADFGLSRLGRTEFSHISTAPQGTPGYLDPQYHQHFHLSDKSDVYSFGVVLVEIITAMKVVDFCRPQNEVNLANFATDRIGNGHLEEIVDPLIDLHSDAWTLCSVQKMAELAFRCLAFHRDMRPSMVEVAAELEQILLSGHDSSKEANDMSSTEISPCSFSSNASETPLSIKKADLKHKSLLLLKTEATSMKSLEVAKSGSPVSVQDPWLSEQSSPS
ncbi:hypothetical protein K2173_027784 [Erythroxylum novogranatense]|uniref:Protein kinase domain-containing protein n=1 Tax=Erythroxylum novogranatense TaxID=1862640 RepID=A0AAV8U048_9ROSI|nr:hypothetical protein K2173_027784 [Erythroxylum novogranatense]